MGQDDVERKEKNAREASRELEEVAGRNKSTPPRLALAQTSSYTASCLRLPRIPTVTYGGPPACDTALEFIAMLTITILRRDGNLGK